MTGWRVHAWVLMGNHYHLLIETPDPNLVAGMQWLQNTYTRRFNTRHRQWGRLFGDRYKSVVVEGRGYYYETLMDYIHLNPSRAGILKAAAGHSVMDYPWSSVSCGYALPPGKRTKWLAAAHGLKVFGFPDTTAGRRRFVARLDLRATEGADDCKKLEKEGDKRRSGLKRGWYWGSQAFSEQVLSLGQCALKKKRHRGYQASEEHRAHGELVANGLLKRGLEEAGLSREELMRLPGSDARKVAIAQVIWENTTMKLSWIAGQLSMKSAANASQQLRRYRQSRPALPKQLNAWILQSLNVA